MLKSAAKAALNNKLPPLNIPGLDLIKDNFGLISDGYEKI